MKIKLNLSILVVVTALTAHTIGLAQSGGKVIDERNVRAHMEFLASDAMQGRGSGSAFEHIAARYVGSQFMQFGLEPAGEKGWDGKPGYVQTVTISRNTFEGNPKLTFGLGMIEHGKEMLVLRATGGTVGGKLQKLNLGDKPEPGAVAFVKLPADAPANPMQGLQAMITAGAAMVIIEETPQYRNNWAAAAGRRITLPSTQGNPSAVVVVSKAAAAIISKETNGTRFDLSGKVTVQNQYTWNAIGRLTGSDKTQAAEVIVLSSHLDHIGIRENAPGPDKIANGADDDASGTVAVMELARLLASGKRPKRTIYFVAFGSEESGGLGSRNFAENLPFPKDKFVANLQFEMIGRPDAKVKPEELWLTGYERSNLGPELAKRGAKLVQDPHPDQNFFQRSDNYTLARQGIIAHTVSSFGLHKDYHQVSDEVQTIDFVHMTRSINSMLKPIVWLANSTFVPVWNEGKKP